VIDFKTRSQSVIYYAFCHPYLGLSKSEVSGTHELALIKISDLQHLYTVGPAECDDYMSDRLNHRHQVYLAGLFKVF
jgi:hypothetical protein